MYWISNYFAVVHLLLASFILVPGQLIIWVIVNLINTILFLKYTFNIGCKIYVVDKHIHMYMYLNVNINRTYFKWIFSTETSPFQKQQIEFKVIHILWSIEIADIPFSIHSENYYQTRGCIMSRVHLICKWKFWYTRMQLSAEKIFACVIFITMNSVYILFILLKIVRC